MLPSCRLLPPLPPLPLTAPCRAPHPPLQAVFNLDLEYSDDEALLDWEQYAGGYWLAGWRWRVSASSSVWHADLLGTSAVQVRLTSRCAPLVHAGMNRVRCCGTDCSPLARKLRPPQWW